jgi:hypothetical protein
MHSFLAHGAVRGVASAIALGLAAMAPSAHAAVVTFSFGCSVSFATTPDSCAAPLGSFGTLSIADSTTNPGNAVDLTWSLTPGAGMGTTLSRFLLNYESPSAPAGLSFSVPGSVAAFGVNGWDTGVAEYGQFDMLVGFTSGALSGTGTLSATSGGLSAANFEASTAGGDPPLLAFYRMDNGNGVYGAVPAPASLALVGLGLLALAAGRRRVAKR